MKGSIAAATVCMVMLVPLAYMYKTGLIAAHPYLSAALGVVAILAFAEFGLQMGNAGIWSEEERR